MARPRGIDHLVLPVRDLEVARERYARMGFTLTPPARHPWGTANSLVQLQGNFLELLSVADAGKIPEHGLGQFSFGAFNRDYLEEREGLSMLVLDSEDARADRDSFAAAGLKTYLPFDFSRSARTPDGRTATVAFTLAFTMDPRAPDAGFFTCQQHAPEHFWKEEYQRHDNGARRIAQAVMVSPEPAQHADFLAAFTGAPGEGGGEEISFATARGTVSVFSPKAAFGRYGKALPYMPPTSAGFAAYHVAVADMDRLRATLEKGQVSFREQDDTVSVGAGEAHGAAVIFEAE